MTGSVALALALLAVVYLFITGIPPARRRRLLRRELQIERTRAVWGEARHELVALVREGKLSWDSETFRTFYGLQTLVLRRPHAHAEISDQFARAILMPPDEQPIWWKEVHTWPPEMKTVMANTAAGIGMLVFGYSGWRKFARISMKYAPGVGRFVWRLIWQLLRTKADSYRPLRTLRNLLQAKERVSQLAEGAFA